MLPGISFDACTWESRRVDKVGNIEVQGVKYSVGDAYRGQRLNIGMRAFTIEARTLQGELAASHTRVYGSQAKTVRRPEQLLPGLLRKPGAVLNSPLQHSLPEPLLTLVLQADAGERRRLLRMLEHATQIAGFDEAVTVMNQITSSGRRIESSEVEMVATRAREQHHADAPGTTRVDLSVYDRFTGVAA